MTGAYWMSSNCSLACTTAPGVTARSWPTSNASVGTIDGTRGERARSEARARRPRTTLPPPVSMNAFHPAGLSRGLLLGAAAAIRLVSRNLIRVSSRQPSPAPATRSSADLPAARYAWTARRRKGLSFQAGSEKRRSRGSAWTCDRPAAIRPSSVLSCTACPATRSGWRASSAASRSMELSGRNRRSTPSAASDSSRSSPPAASTASSAQASPAPGSEPAVTRPPRGAAPRGAGSSRSGPWAARPPARRAAGTCRRPPGPWRRPAAPPVSRWPPA